MEDLYVMNKKKLKSCQYRIVLLHLPAMSSAYITTFAPNKSAKLPVRCLVSDVVQAARNPIEEERARRAGISRVITLKKSGGARAIILQKKERERDREREKDREKAGEREC